MKRTVLPLLFALFCAAQAAAEQTRLVYALPATVPAVIPYTALEKGFFKDEGLDVEAKMFSSGREALQALLAGHAQIQSVSETPVVHAILQGNKIAVIATAARHIEAKLIARTDRGILKPADLRGKKIATLPGTNSDYFMYVFLKKNGIALEDVKIANMPPPEMVTAYAKGDIDGYFAWEPHITYGRRQLPEVSKVFYPGDLYHGWTTVNMDPEFIRQNPQTVRKVVRALLRAEEFVRKNKSEAVRITAARLKIDEKVLRDLWKENVFQVELNEGLLKSMTEIGTWAREKNSIAGPLPDFKDYLYDAALAAEKPSRLRR
ncbi:MAG: NrtA/SsuA/CpmA family ABC transporter substrate-binding protein [Elusimicrobiota bacterium]|jgi:NitT/TauT family transport system substrate-binding protein